MIRNIILKKTTLAALTAAVLSWGGTLSAQTPAPADAPKTEAPKADAPKVIEPKLEEKVAALEAYITNTDPGAAFAAYKVKDKDGNEALPPEFKAATLGTSGPGHNAWMMTSAALVLFMTLPGLALFYGGLVRKKNVLSIMMQCFVSICVIGLLWAVYGYSMAFGPDKGAHRRV